MVPTKKTSYNNTFPKHIKIGILFLCLGLLLINLSFLENSLRQALAFSSFGITMLAGIKENMRDVFFNRKIKYYFIVSFLLVYIFFLNSIISPYQDYGNNKYFYLLFVIVLSFVSSAPLLKYDKARDLLSELLLYSSLFFCFFAIFFANASLGRRSEIGLNPAILARLCMISGIYISCVIYIKGFTLLRGLIIAISIAAVFFTATKTPVPVYLFSFFIVISKGLSIGKKLKVSIYIILLLVLGFVILVNFVPEEFANRILDTDALSRENQSREGNRYDLYGLALDIIANNPQGIGFGGFAKYHRFIIVPHNIILEIAIEMGLFMMITFITWSVVVFKKIISISKDTVSNLFLSVLFTYMFISFMFGGEITIQLVLLYILGGYFSFFAKKQTKNI